MQRRPRRNPNRSGRDGSQGLLPLESHNGHWRFADFRCAMIIILTVHSAVPVSVIEVETAITLILGADRTAGSSA